LEQELENAEEDILEECQEENKSLIIEEENQY